MASYGGVRLIGRSRLLLGSAHAIRILPRVGPVMRCTSTARQARARPVFRPLAAALPAAGGALAYVLLFDGSASCGEAAAKAPEEAAAAKAPAGSDDEEGVPTRQPGANAIPLLARIGKVTAPQIGYGTLRAVLP